MDHYANLGISKTATQEEIKKAYRKLAVQYHPDKTGGDKEAEELFKKISDSYAILNDEKKREEYDRGSFKNFRDSEWSNNGRTYAKNGFDDFVNGFNRSDFKSSSDRARKTQGRTHPTPPSTDHLNIYVNWIISLEDAMLGKKIELNFSREKIVYTGTSGNLLTYTKEKEEKEISITIDLRKKYVIIKKDGSKYAISARVPKLGNEEVVSGLNIWGDIEQTPLIGDLHVTIELDIPENVTIENNKIIQTLDIPLSSVLIGDKKIKVETIVNKKYEVDFNRPHTATNLKFSIQKEGILDDKGSLGEYLVKFNVVLPNVDILDTENLLKLKSILSNCENKT
jgi:DnaJ-class molecular chaperone